MKRQATYDVFISHAREDKKGFVEPLAHRLRDAGVAVWYDDFSLSPGDSLSQSIGRGIAESRFGIVVLSKHFFEKAWTKHELSGLWQQQMVTGKVILPIWHAVSAKEIARYDPPLADIVALDTSRHGLDEIVRKLLALVHDGES
jgi:hypothetical protein